MSTPTHPYRIRSSQGGSPLVHMPRLIEPRHEQPIRLLATYYAFRDVIAAEIALAKAKLHRVAELMPQLHGTEKNLNAANLHRSIRMTLLKVADTVLEIEQLHKRLNYAVIRSSSSKNDFDPMCSPPDTSPM